MEGIKGSDVEILDFIWYGGDSTYENGNALIDMDVVKKADMIFALDMAIFPPITTAVFP